MARGKKDRSDDDDSESDEVLSKRKKSNSAKKGGTKSSATKRTSGRPKKVATSRKIRTKSTSDEESPVEDDASDFEPEEVTAKSPSKDTSVRKSGGRTKTKKQADKNDASSPTHETKRGRKRANDVNEVTSSNDPTEKRSRGRPKKIVNRNEVSSSKDRSDDDEESEKEKAPKAPKGKAGRPPKNKKTEEEQYEVEQILDFKIEDNRKYYLIRWKDCDSSADTWEKQSALHCPGLLLRFLEKHPEARVAARKYKTNRRLANYMKMKYNKKIKFQMPIRIDEDPEYDWEAVDKNQDYKVRKILDVRHHCDGKRDFLIRWVGYSSNSDSWESEDNLNCDGVIQKFMDKLGKITNATPKELREVRKPTQRFTLMTQPTKRGLSKRNDGRQRAAYYDCDE